MTTTPEQLFERLAALGIATQTLEHAPVFTVAESQALHRAMPGAHTKNLFLKSDKGTILLVVAEATTEVDLKALGRRLGVGRLSFAKAELLLEVLGVTPGSVTAFAVISDVTHRVRVVIDERLLAADTINCHPLRNSATTNIARDDLLRFIRACGHEPQVASLGGG